MYSVSLLILSIMIIANRVGIWLLGIAVNDSLVFT